MNYQRQKVEDEEDDIAAQSGPVFVDAGMGRTCGKGAIGVGSVYDIVVRVVLMGHCPGGG